MSDMTVQEALSAIQQIQSKCKDIQLKVVTLEDVLTICELDDTTENAEAIRHSYAWRHWSDFREVDHDEIFDIKTDIEENK